MTKTYKNSYFKNSTPKLPSHCRAHAPRGRDPEFTEGSSSSRARARFSVNRRVEAQSPQLWSCGLFYLSSLPTLSCPLFSLTFSTRKNTTYSMWGTPMIFQTASFDTTKAMHQNFPRSFDPGRSFSPFLFLLEQ